MRLGPADGGQVQCLKRLPFNGQTRPIGASGPHEVVPHRSAVPQRPGTGATSARPARFRGSPLRRRTNSLPDCAEATLKRIFDSVDVNGDGRINKREMIKFCRASPELAASLGFPSGVKQEGGTRDLLEARFQAMDRDDDREVTWEEFFDFFSAEMDQTARLSIAPGNAAAQPVSGDGAKPAQLSQSTGFVQAAWAKMHKSLPDVRNESTLPAGKCQVQSWMRDLQQLQEAATTDSTKADPQLPQQQQDCVQAEPLQEQLQAQEEAFEREFEQKHKEWEDMQARVKDDEAQARQAIMEAAEKLLQDLSDNPFELIPRPSEVSVVEQVASLLEAAADSDSADYSRALRLLHKESARNLERFKFHLRMQIEGFDAEALSTPDDVLPDELQAEVSSQCGGCQRLEAFQHDLLIRAPGACGGTSSPRPRDAPPLEIPGTDKPVPSAANPLSSRQCAFPEDIQAPMWASPCGCLPSIRPLPAGVQEPLGLLDVIDSVEGALPNYQQGGIASSSMLRVGSDTLPGRKAHKADWMNQDACLAIPLGYSRMLVGVFDGHGEQGHEISSSVSMLFAHFADLLANIAEEQSANPSASVPRQMAQLFAMAQDGLERGGLAEWSGTTATLALIDAEAGVVSCAYVGDSRMVICHNQKVLFETVDHDIDSSAERRIMTCGGEVRQMLVSGIDARRVFLKGCDVPGLAMSRALGDMQAQNVGVLSEPEINTCVQLPFQSAVIVASDGVWEKVTSREAAAITAAALKLNSGEQGASIAAKALVSEARSRWIQQGGDVDDITAVVVQMSKGAHLS